MGVKSNSTKKSSITRAEAPSVESKGIRKSKRNQASGMADAEPEEAEGSTPEKVAKTTKKGTKRAADASAAEEATKKARKSKTHPSRASKPSPQHVSMAQGELDMANITVDPPKDPEDYNICSGERAKLLTTIKSLLFVENPTPTFWACCQLGDMRRLKLLVNSFKSSPGSMDNLNITSLPLPLQWSQRFRDTSRPVSNAPLAQGSRGLERQKTDKKDWVRRSEKQRALCKERDNERCVLTKQKRPEAAHISPYTMLNKPGMGSQSKMAESMARFWSLLYNFWNEDRVTRWRSKIFPDPSNPATGVEACFNLICLTPDAHAKWNEGLFALKPLELSDDKKELTIQYFWQPQYDHKPGDRIDLLMKPKPSKGLKSIGSDHFLNYLGDRKIESGQIFKLTTENPETHPLPSWELLEMQWFLQRVVAMSGAAGWPRFDVPDDDDTDYNSMLVEEINYDLGHENALNWTPEPQVNEQAWARGGNAEICVI